MRFFILIALAVPALCAEKRTPLLSPFSVAPKCELKNAVPVKWRGEKLEYSITWGLLKVGRAELWAKDVVDVNGTPCHHITASARSASLVNAFFKVRDFNESWIEAETLYSKGYSQSLREGGYVADEWAAFDSEAKKFKGQRKDKGGKIEFVSGELPGPVQDILSSLYFVRQRQLEVGKEIVLDVNNRKNWPLVVRVLKREKVSTPAGDYDCFLVEPQLRDKGIFVQKGQSLKVWITADEERIPVMVKAEVLIGHVCAWLSKRSFP